MGGYLAGLIEGDGSIIVPKTVRNQKGKLLYPVVKIVFVKKDVPLAIKIKEVIKGGTIEYPKNSNYVVLLFQDLNSIQKIAILINGNMRTPKIEALYRLIDWLNVKSRGSLCGNQPEIPKLGLDSSSLGTETVFFNNFMTDIILFFESILSYFNADTDKESALNDNKGKAGIYLWTNKINGKRYVGSSLDLYRRFMQYYNIQYLIRACEFSLIYKALLKHGYSNFQ